jgi:hypothetical protein
LMVALAVGWRTERAGVRDAEVQPPS